MHTAKRTHGFTESVIRGMTRLASEHDAINLAQGFPNFAAPEVLKQAAARAIADNVNQYAITWGAKRLRDALARKYADWYGMTVNPETELTVTCGATEAMASALLAIVDPGDEVIVFEPFYENYGPDAILCGAKPVYVPMPVDAELDLDRLAAAFSQRTRAIVVCTPSTPTGRVRTRRELEAFAQLCRQYDAYAVTDEIYEHIYYEGEHIPIATLDGMRERTITVSGASKTFSVTGWRVGTIVAPPDASDAIRKVHDFLTVGAPAPLQEAIAVGLETLGDDYYATLAREYRARRDRLCRALVDAGFRCTPPQGAYYVLADFSSISPLPDDEFSVWLTREIGVSPVPGSSFFSRPELGWRPPTPAGRAAGRRASVFAPPRPPRPPRRQAPGSTPGATPARAATGLPRRETPALRAGGTAPPAARRSGRGARIPPAPGAARAPASRRQAPPRWRGRRRPSPREAAHRARRGTAAPRAGARWSRR